MKPDEVLCDCHGQGARVGGECAVLREFRHLRTPEGREKLREDYLDQLRFRVGVLEQGGDASDLAMHVQKMGVPVKVITALRAPTPTSALEAAREFSASKTLRFLLLLGPAGVGKSVAAGWVLKDFGRRYPWNSQPTRGDRPPAMFVEAKRLTRMSAFDSNDSAWLADLMNAQVLVMDDAGDEGTSIGRDAFIDLLLTRYDRERKTIITSNLTGTAFKARYGSALGDRIRETGLVPTLKEKESLRRRVG